MEEAPVAEGSAWSFTIRRALFMCSRTCLRVMRCIHVRERGGGGSDREGTRARDFLCQCLRYTKPQGEKCARADTNSRHRTLSLSLGDTKHQDTHPKHTHTTHPTHRHRHKTHTRHTCLGMATRASCFRALMVPSFSSSLRFASSP